MQETSPTPAPWVELLSRYRWSVVAGLLVVLGAGVGYGLLWWSGRLPGTAHTEEHAPPTEESGDPLLVHMPEARWKGAGIRLAPVGYTPFSEQNWRSGHLTLNETRVAHIAPLVEGVVREVKVRLGQDVKAGEVLAIIDSREVGQAKLNLVKARLGTNHAKAEHTWTQGASQAAVEMVKVMSSGAKVAQIEEQFRDRPIGELRQQLMTAYSRRLQARAYYDAVTQADGQGVIPQGTVIRQRADYEAAEATYRALCEEVNFQAGQHVRLSEQKLREAQTAESLSKSTLMMLGYSPDEVEKMDPIAEGGQVSLYYVRAPFPGTVIDMHAVLAERVGPDHQMFQLADLSALWLKADVPQKDLALVQGLTGKVQFRVSGGEDTTHEGEIFYTGDVIDRETRTVGLTATVPNPGRKLKPGMFVEVGFTRTGGMAMQVPATAIQRQDTQAFVFVHVEGDTFRRVDVKLGRVTEGTAEVLEGLQPNQSVVVSGGFELKSEMLKDQLAGD